MVKQTEFSICFCCSAQFPLLLYCTVQYSACVPHWHRNTQNPFLTLNISLCHTQLSKCLFLLLLGGLFSSTLSHAFIPFHLFSVTKQNLLIFCKAPNESLYACSVPFSHSVGLSHTHSHTHTEWCYLNSCALHSACLLVPLLWCYCCQFYPFSLHSFLTWLWETTGEFNLLTLMVLCW